MSTTRSDIPLPQLHTPPSPPSASSPRRRLAAWLMPLYRIAVLAAIVYVVHYHHTKLTLEGLRPVTLAEVRPVFPTASSLRFDAAGRGGHHVLDSAGLIVGYVATTQPVAQKIIGYAGPTDGLLCFAADGKLVKLIIRWSADTKEHVEDVATDRYFMNKLWPGKTWEDLASLDLQKAGVEGVSGATLTSMALAESIVYRTKWADDQNAAMPLRISDDDVGIAAFIAFALVLTFTHLRGKTWLRRGFQIAVIAYVGFHAGYPLAQNLLAGWASSGVNWRMAPGLALLAAAALVMPWATRRQTYCSHLCPHGAAQELLGRVSKKRLKLRHDVAAGLRWLPLGLLALVLIVTMLRLPFNLAAIEPFDAYLITTAGVATIAIAVVGLIAALFIPQAYCKFGCPTGMLLEFLRSHGRADHFSRRDLAAAALLALAIALHLYHSTLIAWIENTPR